MLQSSRSVVFAGLRGSVPSLHRCSGRQAMLSGSLTYRSRLDGIEFDKIEIRSPAASVEKIDVTSEQGCNVSIEIHIGQIALFREAKALGLREAKRVTNRLAMALGRQCYDPIPK